MDPATAIRRRLPWCIDPPPCLGEILQHLAIGHVLKYLGITGFVQYPAGHGRRYEVDELGSDQREVVLEVGSVEAFVVLVSIEDKLQKPSVAVAFIGNKRRHVLVELEDDRPEGIPLPKVLPGIEFPVHGMFYKAVLLLRGGGYITEGIEPGSVLLYLPFAVEDVLACAVQDTIEGQGIVVGNPSVLGFASLIWYNFFDTEKAAE